MSATSRNVDETIAAIRQVVAGVYAAVALLERETKDAGDE